MNGNGRWLGWLGIGLGALALLIALSGRGFGPQFASGFGSANMPQAYAQPGAGSQNTGPQSSQVAPSANDWSGTDRPGAGQQRGQAAPGMNGQQNRRSSGNRPQMGSGAPGADARGGPGRPGDGGFGFGGWLRFPFKLLGGISRLGMLALLVVLGVWLLRGRGGASDRPAEPAQGPTQKPLSPTGESYTDEPSDQA